MAKAAAGIIGSRSRFERMLRDAGVFEHISPADVVQLQHSIEQYIVAIAANNGLRVRAAAQARAEALSREEARGGPADA